MIIVDPRDIVGTGTSTSHQLLPPTLGWLCFRSSGDIAVSSARSMLDFSRQYSRFSEGVESDIGSMFRLDVFFRRRVMGGRILEEVRPEGEENHLTLIMMESYRLL